MTTKREASLLSWQLHEYPHAHADRRNLAVHALTVPLFMAGTLAVLLAPLLGGWLVAASIPAIVLPIMAQGRTHRLEARAPAPFRGPRDVAARLFAEQLVTFPRFVFSGGFAQAWRASTRASAAPAAPRR